MKYTFAFIALLTMHVTAMATDPVADIKNDPVVTSSSRVDPFDSLNCESFVKVISSAKVHPTIQSKCMFEHADTTWYIDTCELERLTMHTAVRQSERPSEIKFDRVENMNDRIRYYYKATMINPYAYQPADIPPTKPSIFEFKLTYFSQKKA